MCTDWVHLQKSQRRQKIGKSQVRKYFKFTGEKQRGKKERKTSKPCNGGFINLWNGTVINDVRIFFL